MKNDIIAILLIFVILTIAYKCTAQDSLSWVCQSGIGITIEDQSYLNGHIVAGSVTLKNIQADSFQITVRDSFSIVDCDLGNFEIVIYDCTDYVSQSLSSIGWIDSALTLIVTMRAASEVLNQDSCHISGQAALHSQISDIDNWRIDLVEARDSIEAGATGRNLDLFNFYAPYIQADLDQMESMALKYVAILYSDTCERVENRLHGRMFFILDSLFRLNQNFTYLKAGWK